MKIQIVTACPGNKTTSWLGAKRLAAAAERRGWQADIVAAGQPPAAPSDEVDLVVVATSAPVDLAALAGHRVYQVELKAALTGPEHVLNGAEREAQPYIHSAQPLTASDTPAAASGVQRIVAVTACPTGVAHTFMAAEALAEAGRAMGHEIRVETQGSVGAQDELTADEIAAADVVLLACDIEVDDERFAGKRIYRTSTGNALKKSKATIEAALTDGAVESAGDTQGKAGSAKDRGVYSHLLTGVSFMLPVVVAGGLCIALSFVFGIHAAEEKGTFAAALMQIGAGAAFKLMVPVLAGYIAYSIADRPGLTPGLIGGMLATDLGAGFLGGIIAGFLAGYAALAVKKLIPLPASIESLKPILIIPLLSSLVTGLVMIYVVGTPVAAILSTMTNFLNSMGSTNAVLLGALLGGMMCIDMGGPINKAAYTFGVGLISTQTYLPMGAIMAGGMVPPIAMGIASIVARAKFADAEREGGKAALVLGLCFITEGAIPFAAKDPIRVIPCCVVGGAITGALSMLFGCKLMAPHGGLFVMLIPNAVSHALLYLVAIVAGSLVTGLVYAVIKPRLAASTADGQSEIAMN